MSYHAMPCILGVFEYPQHMFKLIGKIILTIFLSKICMTLTGPMAVQPKCTRTFKANLRYPESLQKIKERVNYNVLFWWKIDYAIYVNNAMHVDSDMWLYYTSITLETNCFFYKMQTEFVMYWVVCLFV